MVRLLRAVFGCALLFTLRAQAQEEPGVGPGATPVPELSLTVEGERPMTAASSRTVQDRDLQLRPISSPEDVLRVVPGLVIAQHQGGGKADQLFLRGFDSDHGTDVAVSIDGVPVNMVSHAHGQGYADLHFIIPETIERVRVTKGPYFAELGDFDTAGAVDLVTRKRFERSEIGASSGIFPTLGGRRDDGTPRTFAGYRALGIGAAGDSWFAAEISGTGGPFIASERLQRFNLMAKTSARLSPIAELTATASAYGSGWTGSGQIPARLVDAGVLDRFGAIDPTEGGDTQRFQGRMTLRAQPDAGSALTATLSAIRYALTLFNDFTFRREDPVHGDEIEQDDERTTLYASLRYERRIRRLVGSFGLQVRHDEIDASLWKVEKRVRLDTCLAIANPCVDTHTRETSAGLWGQLEWQPVRMLRLIGGLRADLYGFDVRSRNRWLDPEHLDPVAPTAQRSLVSPKLNAVLTPIEELDLFFNFGSGFHSNDARSAVETGGAGALPRALGGEIGARARLFHGSVELAAALWRLDLDSELVWVGDFGGTVPSAPTRRYGVDLEGRWQITPWLWADVDLTFSRSRYQSDAGNGNAVALAPPRVITGGLSARHPSGLVGAVRLRHIGSRPASELTAADGVPRCTAALGPDARCFLTADGYTVLDATAGYDDARLSLLLFVENLTNASYREAQFGNVSRVADEPQAVQDLHFTPGNPLSLRLSAAVRF